MKIKQYAGGGIVYTPFVSNRGIPQNYVETPSTPTSKKNEDSDWLNKEYVKMIQHNGLISDVNQTMDKMKHWHTYAKNMSNSYLMGGDNQYDLLSQMFDIQKEINANKRMQDSWTQAQTNAYNQGALGEVATTAGGNIYVWTKEGVTSVTPEEYSKNRGTGVYMDYNEDGSDYLTNNELLDIRERYVPGNTNLISNVSSTKGLSTITKEIRDIVKEFGHESITEYIKRTGNKITQSAWDGMQILIGEGPDGYYKVTTKTERRHVNDAVNYLLESIGAQSRNKLRATVAARGGNPNDDKEVYGIVLDALTIHTDYSQDPNFEKTATEYDPDGDGKGTSKTTYVEQTRAERYASGNGFGNPQWLPILSSDKSTPMYVSAQNLGPVLSKDEKTLFGDANLEEVLNDAYGIGGIVDRSAITFGEMPITWDDASKLMFEGGTNMYRALVPVKRDSTGKLRPNFELQEKINEMNENSLFKNMSAESIRNVVADIPGVRYNEQTGLIEATEVAPFLVLQATASTDTLSGDLKSMKYLHDLSNEEDRKKKSKYNDITGTRPSYGGGEKRQSTGNPKTTWWMGYQFYSGNIFIPINDSIIAAAVYNDQLVPRDTYVNMSAKEQARQDFQQKQMVTDYLVQNGDIRLNF